MAKGKNKKGKELTAMHTILKPITKIAADEASFVYKQ